MKREPETPLERIAETLRYLADDAMYRGLQVNYSIQSEGDVLLIEFSARANTEVTP